MIDLLVLHPGGQHGIFGALGDTLTALEPPTWARILAGYIRNLGYKVQILDQEALHLSASDAAARAYNIQPGLIAVVVFGHQPSASTQQMTAAGEFCLEMKKRNPLQKIIMMGNHPSALPVRTLKEEAVDYAADGEGLSTIEGLLADHNPSDVRGLVWRTSHNIIQNPLAPLHATVELLGDAWDLLPMTSYRAHNWHHFTGPRQPYASIYTSFGCPHACTFCMINSFQHINKYRCIDPVLVVNQIEQLCREYGVRSLKIADEMFILNENHYIDIAEGIITRGLTDLNIWAYSRIDSIKPNKLKLLREAGVKWLALGIESASGEVRDGAEKRLRRGDIVDVVREVQRHGINVVGNFIFGLRDDNAETMQETLDLAKACLPEWANFYSTMAYPGSPLYDQALKEGWTLPTDWHGFSQHNQYTRPLDTKYITGDKVLAFRDAAFREYFSASAYKDLVQTKFGNEAVAEIDRMLSYRLKRNLLGN